MSLCVGVYVCLYVVCMSVCFCGLVCMFDCMLSKYVYVSVLSACLSMSLYDICFCVSCVYLFVCLCLSGYAAGARADAVLQEVAIMTVSQSMEVRVFPFVVVVNA